MPASTLTVYRSQNKLQPHLYLNFIKITILFIKVRWTMLTMWALCNCVTEFLNCCSYSVWRTDLKVPTITTTPPVCGWEHAAPEVAQNQSEHSEVNSGEVGQWTGTTNVTDFFNSDKSYAVSEYRPQLVIFTTCSDSATALIVETMVFSGYCM